MISANLPLAAICRSDVRGLIALMLALLLLAPYHLQAQPGGPKALNIEIVEGDGAINNLRLRTAREAIVEVQDENHKPVSGALVLFSAKGGNPFARTVLRATTDSTGRVRANPLDLNSKAGRFDIHVKASYHGKTTTRVIHETNSAQGGPDTGTQSVTTNVSAVGVKAVPAGAGFSAVGILVIAALAAGGVVGGLFGAGVIGGGGKSAQVSVGVPHF